MVGAEMKYVTFDGHNGEQIIIFPKIIQHSVMADDVKKSSFGGMRPIAGGFVVGGQCVGESESLRMKSRGELDTTLIRKLLYIGFEEEVPVPEILKQPKLKPSKNKLKRLRKRAQK